MLVTLSMLWVLITWSQIYVIDFNLRVQPTAATAAAAVVSIGYILSEDMRKSVTINKTTNQSKVSTY